MTTIPIWQVDAFTDRPFAGNPAAVCLVDEERDASWMQSLAAEMNLSETAFVRPLDDGYSLRWFTPTIEVPLCGHATLASAHVLYSAGVAPQNETIRLPHPKRCPHRASEMAIGSNSIFPRRRPRKSRRRPDCSRHSVSTSSSFIGKTSLDTYLVVTEPARLRTLAPTLPHSRQSPTASSSPSNPTTTASIFSPASSPRRPASTKTPSRAPPTALSRPIGALARGKKNWSVTRPPRAAASCIPASKATA